jgi:hypothetical protein
MEGFQMMRWTSFIIQVLVSCFFVLVIGSAFYYQFNHSFPFPDQMNPTLFVLTYRVSLVILILAFVIYLVSIFYGRRISNYLFCDIHKKAQRVEVLQEKSLKELHDLRESWTTFTHLKATYNEGTPPDWKACLYEIKRVLDDMLRQIQFGKATPNQTLVNHIQVQIEYLERQIEAWMEGQDLHPVSKALEPLPDEVNKALSYIDQLLAEKSERAAEEEPFEPLPPRRERGKIKKAKRPFPKKDKQLNEEAPSDPLPPRKVVHIPWWRKIGRRQKSEKEG